MQTFDPQGVGNGTIGEGAEAQTKSLQDMKAMQRKMRQEKRKRKKKEGRKSKKSRRDRRRPGQKWQRQPSRPPPQRIGARPHRRLRRQPAGQHMKIGQRQIAHPIGWRHKRMGQHNAKSRQKPPQIQPRKTRGGGQAHSRHNRGHKNRHAPSLCQPGAFCPQRWQAPPIPPWKQSVFCHRPARKPARPAK